MTANRLLQTLLRVNGAVVDSFELDETSHGDGMLTAHVRLHKRLTRRCPVCGRRCPVHDYASDECFWRGQDLGPLVVRIGCTLPRVRCPEHGVRTAGVPWAPPNSGFTYDFAYSTAWMLRSGVNRTKVSERQRVDWDTVGRLVDLVWKDLEPDVRKRFDGLVEIGIDETSYRKGHSYVTTVVNHRTNTVVWAHVGFGKEVIELFFEELTPEQRASIRVVTGDGARWISDAVAKYCPGAERCLDPFHVVEWANAALDGVRVDAWRRALAKLAALRKVCAAATDERKKAEIKDRIGEAKKEAEEIKHSRYALGKNPENLTQRQNEKLAVIQAGDGPMSRAWALKEQLRAILRMSDANDARNALTRWLADSRGSGIAQFSELANKVERNSPHILNAIRLGVSNARIEALNNKIKLLIRIAYGFRNIDTMISLIMLFCSSIEIPWMRKVAENPVKQRTA